MTDRPKPIIRGELTPELRARWLRAVEEEEAARPANSAKARATLAAIEEDSLSGELRRAIVAANHNGVRVREVAARAGVPFEALNEFMGGRAPLDTDAAGRIAAVLDCHLVPSA